MSRPDKNELEERKRRQKAWVREQEHRRQMESRIKQGLVEVITWDEATLRHMRGEALGDDVLVAFPEDPLAVKLRGVRPEHADDALRRAMMDLLVESEDQDTRRAIASALERIVGRTENQRKRDERRSKVTVIKWELAAAERRGWVVDPELSDGTPGNAREQIAVTYGFPSGEAMRKFLETYDRDEDV